MGKRKPGSGPSSSGGARPKTAPAASGCTDASSGAEDLDTAAEMSAISVASPSASSAANATQELKAQTQDHVDSPRDVPDSCSKASVPNDSSYDYEESRSKQNDTEPEEDFEEEIEEDVEEEYDFENESGASPPLSPGSGP